MTTITGIDPQSTKAVDILVEEGRIAEIRKSSAEPDCYVAPGFIDLQVNGFGGHDLNEDHLEPATVLHVAEEVLHTGVTTFLPTLITQSEEHLLSSLAAIREAVERFPLVRKVVAGVHMEGPFISPEDGACGAHPREHVRPPSLEEVDRWQSVSGNLIRLVTLSPHWDGAAAAIGEMRRRGIHVSIGHTHADAVQIHDAAAAGAELSTHLGNGVAAMLPRHPNLIWAQLADERLVATLIADSHHLDRDTLLTILRSKGLGRSILVSDAVALTGMPPGRYVTSVGGEVELSLDGRLGLVGTAYLAGAARSVTECLSWLLEVSCLSLAQALALVTINPARFVGRGGTLQPASPADLVCFRHSIGEHLAVSEVWLDGERRR